MNFKILLISRFYFIGLLTFSGASLAQTAPVSVNRAPHPLVDTFQLNGAMKSKAIDEGENFSRTFGLGLNLKAFKTWSAYFSSVISIGINMENGASDFVLNDEHAARSSFGLDEAYIQFNPISTAGFRVGSLNQRLVKNPLLVGSKSFPGTHEYYEYRPQSNLSFTLDAEQSIAYATNSDDTRRKIQDQPPAFFFERIGLLAAPTTQTTVNFGIGHFLFDQLPSVTAYYSRTGGNTITGISKEGSAFAYDFQGVSMDAKVAVEFGQYTLSTLGAAARNYQAPQGLNQGRMGGMVLEKNLDRLTLGLGGYIFYTERDVAPAEFNDKVLGHNNRNGNKLKLFLKDFNNGLLLELMAINADEVKDLAYQDKLTYYSISLGTLYDGQNLL